VTPGPVFNKCSTPDKCSTEKDRILLELAQAFQIRSNLWCRRFWYTKKLGYGFRLINNSSYCICFGNCFLSLARKSLMCTLRHSQVKASKPTVHPPLSWLLWKKEKNLHVNFTLLSELISPSYKLALLMHQDMCLVQR